MDSALLALAIAFLSGMTMAVQGTLNSALGQVTGLWEATLIVQGVGLAVAGVLVFPLGTGSLAKAVQAPWYTWLGGALGVLIVYTVAKSIPKVGVAPATTAIIVGQVGTAFLLDHLGILGLEKVPFQWSKALGLLLLAGGAWLLLRQVR
ncbi:MAG: DMT family transporter [Firmicutes bacterium]|nr:DMT family transporter [Bacillota bacterium]